MDGQAVWENAMPRTNHTASPKEPRARRRIHTPKGALFVALSVWAICLLPATLQPSAAQLGGPSETTVVGPPLRGLTPEQTAAFQHGVEDMIEVETIEDGLGPVFNGKSCAECHAHPMVGGSSPDREGTVVVRIARRYNDAFDAMAEYGGMVLQRRSIKEIDPSCPIPAEQIPPEATFVSRRITPPLFGLGLVEAIPGRHSCN
jgi:hypothetical protein